MIKRNRHRAILRAVIGEIETCFFLTVYSLIFSAWMHY